MRTLAPPVAPGLLAALAGLALAGCGLAGCGLGAGPASTGTATRAATGTATPAATSTATPAPGAPAGATASSTATAGAAAKLARAQRTHEYLTPVPRQRVIGGWRSAVQAVQVFATTYINWNAGTVSPRLRALAEVSVGQARSAMSLAAAQTAHDYELQRGGIANSGVVEAIAPVLDQPDQYAVVTRETTTATRTTAYQGLTPAWHVALATVTRVQGGLWVLSAWQPEN
jgi:hypothetical protein